MGRPINKHKLAGMQANFNVAGARGVGTVQKQTGSKRFVVKCNGIDTVLYLVPKSRAALAPGEMSIIAVTADGPNLYVAKITQRKVTTSDGLVHPWGAAAPTYDIVQIVHVTV